MEVQQLALLLTESKPNTIHFVYLGLPIAYSMSKKKGWDTLVERFNNRLSKWKASLFSIGGRSTLLTSVLGALGTYYFSLFPMPKCINKLLESIRAHFFWSNDGSNAKIPWVAWKVVMADKNHDGLGLGSLISLNHALIQKWWWRFFSNLNTLWSQLISEIHDRNVEFSEYSRVARGNGVWVRILKDIHSFHDQNVIPYNSMKKKV